MSLTHRIVYTRHNDGGVSVCWPAPQIIDAMSAGGFWGHLTRAQVARQIESKMARGVTEDAAHRFARAMTVGGLSTQEAYAMIRDHDCAMHGSAFELTDYRDLPDRWFRNAWKQGANSRQIYVDLELARPLQWARIRQAAKREQRRRAEAFEDERPLSVDWPRLKTVIKRATDVDGLRRVWPEELSSHNL